MKEFKNVKLYDWVDFFKSICKAIDVISFNKDQRNTLLKEKAKYVFGETHPIYTNPEIDPLSFIYTLAQKNTINQRVVSFQNCIDAFTLDINLPTDWYFPTPTPQTKSLYYKKGEYVDNDGGIISVDVIWELFSDAINNRNLNNEQFKNILSIINVGVVKLTQTLFLINAEKFLPIDERIATLLPVSTNFVKEINNIGIVKYEQLLEFYKKKFPSCYPYEVNLFLSQFTGKEKKHPLKKNFFQISTMVDGQKHNDYYNDFINNSEVRAGGSGDHKTRGGEYPLDKVADGDIIIVRRGTKNMAGIGVVLDNEYLESGYSEDKVIKIVWINKAQRKLNNAIGDWSGFNIATANTIQKVSDSYSDTFDLIDSLVGSKNNTISENSNSNIMENINLNQILYGPPGTGKTHKLLNEYYSHFEMQNKTVSKKEFEFEIINQLSWWQVFTLVLLETKNATVPEIKKHRFVEYKLQVSNTKSLSQTVWGQLSAHTIEDSTTVQYDKRTEPLIFNKSAGSVWEIVVDKEELIDELVELSQQINDYEEKHVISKNYKFITFHQSFSYEDFIEGIKPILNKELSDESSEVSYVVEKGIFYECCNAAAKLAGFLSLNDSIENYSKEERAIKYKNSYPYGLFIDEINRGNISQIFGELITLIEDTKRLGKDEVIVELPYSKSKFGVPPNLYIIGTMNTADRSIEALDTALRRRFCFEEMTSKENLLSPSAMYCRLLWKYEKVGWDDSEFVEKESNLFNLLGVSEQWDSEKVDIWDKMTKAENKNLDDYFSKLPISGINLETLLEKINERIEVLLNRDHKIGHSYFIDVNSVDDLRLVFKNNIVPLLQEYFYGDYEKIGWILGEGFFVERKLDKNGVFTKFFKQPKPEFEVGYQLIDLDKINIETAVQKLLGTFKENTVNIEN